MIPIVVIGVIAALDWVVGLFRRPTSSWTIEEERERNRYLRSRVLAIIGSEAENIATPANRQNEWSGASLAQREIILANLFAELQGIMGTSANPRLEWRNSGNLGLFFRNHTWIGMGHSSHFSLNRSILSEDLAVRAFRIIAHEVRHAYQWEAVRRPGTHRVANVTSDAWRANFNSQIRPGWPNALHIESPIEWDAYYFAGQITRNSQFRNHTVAPAPPAPLRLLEPILYRSWYVTRWW